MIVLHEKVKNAAAGVAAEAVVYPLLLAHGKRRAFLGVKRTQTHMITPGFLERDVIRNHLNDGGAVTNLGDFFLGNHDSVFKLSCETAPKTAPPRRS